MSMETPLPCGPIMPRQRLGVYFASKLCHYKLGITLEEYWTEFDWTSRWVTQHVGKVPNSECYAKEFWEHDFDDVAASDVVLVYAKNNDVLNGALVEAGIGLGLGKKVIVVGDCDSYSTWQYHARVYRVPTLHEAHTLLLTMAL